VELTEIDKQALKLRISVNKLKREIDRPAENVNKTD
jgi:hypothetical protein